MTITGGHRTSSGGESTGPVDPVVLPSAVPRTVDHQQRRVNPPIEFPLAHGG